MPIDQLEGGFNIRFKYRAVSKPRDVELLAETTGPIHFIIMPTEHLARFDASKSYDDYASAVVNGSKTILAKIPAGQRWALVIMNKGRGTTAVHWEFVT